MSTAIVLVNWNGWRDSIACIRSCLSLDHPDFRIILCDNDSRDGSVERIMAWARGEESFENDPTDPAPVAAPRLPRGVALLDRAAAERGEDGDGAELIVVRTGGNLGFAGGNNVGLRWALARGFDKFWLLNNDTVVPTDALTTLDAAVDAPGVGIAGSVLVEYHDASSVQAYAGAVSRRTFRGRHLGQGIPVTDHATIAQRIGGSELKPGEIMYPVGASMLVTRAFLENVGLMEESYFLYYEEADWVLRGLPNYRAVIAPDSRVYHKHGASAGSTSEGGSTRSMGFLYRSRLRVAKLRAPAAMPWVVLGLLNEGGRALLRGRPGKFQAALRALTGRVQVPIAVPKTGK